MYLTLGSHSSAEESKQQLEQQRQELTGRRADLSVALAEREAELAQLRHALAQSPLAASLERLEQRIRWAGMAANDAELLLLAASVACNDARDEQCCLLIGSATIIACLLAALPVLRIIHAAL